MTASQEAPPPSPSQVVKTSIIVGKLHLKYLKTYQRDNLSRIKNDYQVNINVINS